MLYAELFKEETNRFLEYINNFENNDYVAWYHWKNLAKADYSVESITDTKIIFTDGSLVEKNTTDVKLGINTNMILGFGKYKSKTLQYVIQHNKSYLNWMKKNFTQDSTWGEILKYI